MSEKVLNEGNKQHSVEEYLRAERANVSLSEFVNGKIMPKTNSNRWHSLIGTNIAIAAGSRLHGHKCDIYVGNMRVLLKNTRICYPDVVIVNGEPNFTDANSDVLLNPAIVVEIFSSSTNSSSKTEKLESYLALDSIRECLLVKEDEMRVEHYSRQNAKQWIYRIYNERDDVVSLESINCKVSIQEIYANIKFRQAELSSKAVN